METHKQAFVIICMTKANDQHLFFPNHTPLWWNYLRRIYDDVFQVILRSLYSASPQKNIKKYIAIIRECIMIISFMIMITLISVCQRLKNRQRKLSFSISLVFPPNLKAINLGSDINVKLLRKKLHNL